jgi:hypothetical protein
MALPLFVALTPLPAFAAVAQWDFNGGPASSTGGSNLVGGAALPASSAGISYTTVSINNQPAQVAAFTRGTYFRLTHGFGSSGGGTFVNSYTLIMDVMFPSRPTGWAALWQTARQTRTMANGSSIQAGALAFSETTGDVQDQTWNHLALVVDAAQEPHQLSQ